MAADREPFVIVGGGLAGAKGAEALREQGYDGPIVMFAQEPERPYERPALSKDFLLGKAERDSVFVHPADWYEQNDVDVRLGTRVTSVDCEQRRVHGSDGPTVPYSRLLLATGAEPRRLPIPGGDLPGLLYLRRIGDSERLREVIAEGGRLVVIGGGWIGLEVAAAARAAGADVVVVEQAALPLEPVLGPELARVFADLHWGHGVDLRTGARVAEITSRQGKPVGVRLADGTDIDADAVLVAVGAAPQTALAEAAGLAVDNGVLVDEHLRASDENVYAVGDIANAYHPWLDRRIRVEHWANALNQPRVAASGMVDRDEVYDRLPYFYTDQYDLGMEYTGYAEPGEYDDVVIRGDLEAREFVAFWTRAGRVLAGMNVNVWDVTAPINRLIRSRQIVDRARLADPDVPLEELAGPAD